MCGKDWNASMQMRMMDAMVAKPGRGSDSLAAAGYVFANLDDGWMLAPPAGQPAHTTFSANFSLLLGGGAESGVCVSYGPLPVANRSTSLLARNAIGSALASIGQGEGASDAGVRILRAGTSLQAHGDAASEISVLSFNCLLPNSQDGWWVHVHPRTHDSGSLVRSWHTGSQVGL